MMRSLFFFGLFLSLLMANAREASAQAEISGTIYGQIQYTNDIESNVASPGDELEAVFNWIVRNPTDEDVSVSLYWRLDDGAGNYIESTTSNVCSANDTLPGFTTVGDWAWPS